ncbi:MAG: CRISPR-associated endoribonuclease Cas6 [Cytophagales bacterium]|nr:CRISPR-associated endoribonuclease Cas6 [Cytophagales bacterium]
MRIHFKIASDRMIVPYAHQHLLTGKIHKWIGQNKEHGQISLYSFSTLEGGKTAKEGLKFENGSSFFFSCHDPELAKKLIKGVQADPKMFCGLKVIELILQEDPDLVEKERFYTASPIFIKRKEGDKIKHYRYDDIGVSDFLRETLLSKMKKAGLEDETLSVEFDKEYCKAKCKVVHYNGVKNKANVCPVIIKAKPETKVFAWNVGLGNSTGIGLGAIK